jgi:hypothetical protein
LGIVLADNFFCGILYALILSSMNAKSWMVRVLASIFLCSLAHGTPIVYTAALTGAAEAFPNASPGTGSAIVTFDAEANTMQVQVTFSGLLGATTASHIHAATAAPGTGTAGVATTTPYFTGFPIGVTSGSYDSTFDMTLASSYNPAYVTANGGTTALAEAALGSALAAGKAYFNIHSTPFPGGEIRGFLTSASVPENSATAPLMVLGFAAVAGLVRLQRARAA